MAAPYIAAVDDFTGIWRRAGALMDSPQDGTPSAGADTLTFDTDAINAAYVTSDVVSSIMIMSRSSSVMAPLEEHVNTMHIESTSQTMTSNSSTQASLGLSEINDFEHHVTAKGRVNLLRFNRATDEQSIEVTYHYTRLVLQSDI